MTKIEEIEKIVNEHRYQLGVTLPVHTVEYLLDLKNELDRMREQKNAMQRKLKYYTDVHPATIREVRALRKEINRLRKEGGQHAHTAPTQGKAAGASAAAR